MKESRRMVQLIYPFVHPSACLPIHIHFYIYQAILIQPLFIYLFLKNLFIFHHHSYIYFTIHPFIYPFVKLFCPSTQDPPFNMDLLKNQPIHSLTCVEKSWYPLSFSASCVVNVIKKKKKHFIQRIKFCKQVD